MELISCGNNKYRPDGVLNFSIRGDVSVEELYNNGEMCEIIISEFAFLGIPHITCYDLKMLHSSMSLYDFVFNTKYSNNKYVDLLINLNNIGVIDNSIVKTLCVGDIRDDMKMSYMNSNFAIPILEYGTHNILYALVTPEFFFNLDFSVLDYWQKKYIEKTYRKFVTPKICKWKANKLTELEKLQKARLLFSIITKKTNF